MSSLITDSFKKTKRTAGQGKQDCKSDVQKAVVDPREQRDLETLKHFDLTLEFGPCSGITRMERWLRAEKHGLNPPGQVKDIIDQHTGDDNYTQCLWKDYSI